MPDHIKKIIEAEKEKKYAAEKAKLIEAKGGDNEKPDDDYFYILTVVIINSYFAHYFLPGKQSNIVLTGSYLKTFVFSFSC